MKWEYRLIASHDLPKHGFLGAKGPEREEIVTYLNELGADGWEIVNIDFLDTNTVTPYWAFQGLAKRPL